MPGVALPNFGGTGGKASGGKGGALATAKAKYERGKKVGHKSKTGKTECSDAMSAWKTSGMTPGVAATLGKCRSMARAKKQGDLHAAAGNTAKAQVLHHRAETGKVGQKSRLEQARQLKAARAAKSQVQHTTSHAPSGQPVAGTGASHAAMAHAATKPAATISSAVKSRQPGFRGALYDNRTSAPPNRPARADQPNIARYQQAEKTLVANMVAGRARLGLPPLAPIGSSSATPAPTKSVHEQIAHHRAEAAKHEALAAEHGKKSDAFKAFLAKGKAPTLRQRAQADSAESKRIIARHEAAHHHAEANRLAAGGSASAGGGLGGHVATAPVVAATTPVIAASTAHATPSPAKQPFDLYPPHVVARARSIGRTAEQSDYAEKLYRMSHDGRVAEAESLGIPHARKLHTYKLIGQAVDRKFRSEPITNTGPGPVKTIVAPTGTHVPPTVQMRPEPAHHGEAIPARPTVTHSAPAPAKPASSSYERIDSATFANRVKAAASSVGPEGRLVGGPKVFIGDAHAAYERAHGPMPIHEFKARLLRANTDRHLDMRRADMAFAMDQGKINASSTVDRVGGKSTSEFHFVVAEHKPGASGGIAATHAVKQFHQGEEIEPTGKTQTIGGGKFEEFRYLTGPKQGQTGVRQSKEAKQSALESNQVREKDMQDGFRRLRESGKSDQSPTPSSTPVPPSSRGMTAAPKVIAAATGRGTPERIAKAKAIRDSAEFRAGRSVLKNRFRTYSTPGQSHRVTYEDKSGVAPSVYSSRKEATQAIMRAHQREDEFKAKRAAEETARRRKNVVRGMVGLGTGKSSVTPQSRYRMHARESVKQGATGFKSKEITLAAKESPVVKAHVKGDVAVHPSLAGSGYNVTHVGTGLMLANTSSLARAKEIAGALDARKIDLKHVSDTRATPASKKTLAYIKHLFGSK